MSADQNEPSGSLHADRPIRKKVDDKLGRDKFAHSIAAQIQLAPRGDSFVIGIVGPWGSGKTSILNLVEEELGEDSSQLFLWFNPWLFAGHKELVAHFFHEVAAQLRDKDRGELRDIWRGFEGYSRLLRPLRAVSGVERESSTDAREPSVRRQRELLEEALEKAPKRLVIVLDDLDRLEDDEIRDVMRLVRLLADFPNTIYLLSYDQKRVVEALGGEERGRAYLEKIVQTVHQVPEIRPSEIRRVLEKSVHKACADLPLRRPEPVALSLAFQKIQPLFHGLRDVYRYINSLRPTLIALGEEVALQDILKLEALRVLAPAAFDGIVQSADMLTHVLVHGKDREDEQKRVVQRLFESWGERRPVYESICKSLFSAINHLPRGGVHYGPESLAEWRRDGRVACRQIFEVYLERALPPGRVPSRLIREFLESTRDESELSRLLSRLEKAELDDLLKRLEDHKDELQMDEDGTAIKVLLQQIRRVHGEAERKKVVTHIMYAYELALLLLSRIDPSKRLAIVKRELEHSADLSTREYIVSVNQQYELLYEADIAKIDNDLAMRVLDEPAANLADEPRLGALMTRAAECSKEGAESKFRELAADDGTMMKMLSRLLFAGIDEESHSLHRWDELAQALDPQKLAERLKGLDTKRDELSLDGRSTLALDVALRYAGGWRPRIERVRQSTAAT
ncbi:KAP family P-loop NTPase fold protein [Polyangium aurulentum]|uniref:KAP family P-loop NTPase fold protein n=1 Tax=Polyangium aurulentum TaxID=2567896 RepID=UPI00146B66B6|nr:P-loop NTPase fold protein [Polyangium aurulentum]UQA61762.1 KAP family NTPase [Polyangium aurulentum]